MNGNNNAELSGLVRANTIRGKALALMAGEEGGTGMQVRDMVARSNTNPTPNPKCYLSLFPPARAPPARVPSISKLTLTLTLTLL